MKKLIYIILIIFILSIFMYSNNDKIIIPDESIRFRIIANGNELQDQALKQNIRKDLENNIFKLIENSKSIEETRQIINDNQDLIKQTLDNYNTPYNINYGYNYFPEKVYDGTTYSEGEYESLVITLGEAKGDNWWCVMYPPLCLLDSEEEDVEYEFFLTKIFKNLF